MHETAAKLADLLIEFTSDLNRFNDKNLTPLMCAVSSSNLKALQLALDKNPLLPPARKFNLNLQGAEHEWTLMHFAISKANLQIIFALLKSPETTNLSAMDKNGKRAFQFCPYSSPIYKLIHKFILDQDTLN